MTPYTKKIVELHKIHKAIEEKDCCNGGGNTPSDEITIDDVVKFIHDNINDESSFPFINWIDIPNYSNAKPGDYCKATELGELAFDSIILAIPHYIIGIKGIKIPQL